MLSERRCDWLVGNSCHHQVVVYTFSLFVSLDSFPGGGEGTQMSSGMFYFELVLF